MAPRQRGLREQSASLAEFSVQVAGHKPESKKQVVLIGRPLHQKVTKVTCAQDLQQLVNHVSIQLMTCNSCAPEAPATAPSSDAQKAFEQKYGKPRFQATCQILLAQKYVGRRCLDGHRAAHRDTR